MLKVGDLLDMKPIKFKITVIKMTEESLDLEFELGANSGGTPIHVHPNAIETYEVLEGKFDAYKDGAWKTYGVGEKIIIEKGVPHTLRNSSDKITRVLNTHQPALKMAEYFEKLNNVVNSGVIKDEKISLKAMMHLMLLMTSYKDEIVPVNPPAPVAGVFGFLGKLAGYKI